MSDVPSRPPRRDRIALERDRTRAPARPDDPPGLEHVLVRNGDDGPDECVVLAHVDADAPAGAWIAAQGSAFVSRESIR